MANDDIILLIEGLLFSLWKQELLSKVEMEYALSRVSKEADAVKNIDKKDE